MRQLLCLSAAVAALALPTVAGADEAEILAHYEAYETAMSQLRYDLADVEAEAAWRAAEAEWGGIEDTAVLAFNLVRLRLMADRRTESIEAAERIAELARSGNAQSITPPEVALFTTLAEFDGVEASRSEVSELEDSLAAYAPTDYVGKRIALLGWSYAANARIRHNQPYDALEAAQNAQALAMQDATAPTALTGAVALIGARAGYDSGNVEAGIIAADRGIASFPPQPAGQPLDPQLVSLLVWAQGLKGIYFQEESRPYMPTDPTLANPRWDDGRYATDAGCAPPMWETPPAMGRGGSRSESMGAVFEYTLDASGAVSNVVVSGAASDEPFADALRQAKAPAPESAACQGPFVQINAFLMPKSQGSGARSGN